MKKVVSLKGGSPWGFRLVGGTDFRTFLAISRTTFGGKADVAGLKPTDRIVSINNQPTSTMTHQDAKDAVKNAGTTLTLEIECGQDVAMTKLTSKMNETTLLPPPPADLPPPPADLPSPPADLPSPPSNLPPPPPVTAPLPSPATSLPPPPPSLQQTSFKIDMKKPTSSASNNKPASFGSKFQQQRSSDDYAPDFVIQQPRNETNSVGTNATEEDRLVCEDCKADIRGPYVSALGKIWHPEHFVCTKCTKTLQNCGFIEEKGKRFCQSCYETHFARECKKCFKRIFGNSVAALDAFWHPECFVCAVCSHSFDGSGFIVQDGLPYCESDYNVKFSIKCRGCNGVIGAGQNYVEAANSSYHSVCFKCYKCATRLENSKFYVTGGHIRCVQCN